MLERWLKCCAEVSGTADAAALFTILESLYANPARAYHNLDHINACLCLLDEHRRLAQDPIAIELALWLHDCVYVASRNDNEARSAAIAGAFCRELAIPKARSELIAALIMTTRHLPGDLVGDHALIADLDMAILAVPHAEYDAYAAAIRREYAFASDPDYIRGRSDFLQRMLQRPRLYHVDVLRERWESPARANLSRELERLGR